MKKLTDYQERKKIQEAHLLLDKIEVDMQIVVDHCKKYREKELMKQLTEISNWLEAWCEHNEKQSDAFSELVQFDKYGKKVTQNDINTPEGQKIVECFRENGNTLSTWAQEIQKGIANGHKLNCK